MSWDSVGRLQKCNKPYVQRAYEPKKTQKAATQEDKEFKGDVNARVIDLMMRVVVLGQLPDMRR